MFWIIPLVAVASFALTIALELRSHRRKSAVATSLLSVDVSASPEPGAVGAIEGLAAPPWPGAFVQAPLTGSNALAYHIEVILRERRMVGGGEEITTRRLFQEASGQVLVARGGALVGAADLAGGTSLLPVSDDYVHGATVFSSTTSMLSRGQVPPASVAHFLGSRGLPFPTQDSLTRPGVKVTVNERIIVPDQPIWVAGRATKAPGPDGRPIAHFAAEGDETLYFGVGTTAQALQAMQPKMLEVVWTAFVVAMLLSICSGMIVALVVPLIVKAISGG